MVKWVAALQQSIRHTPEAPEINGEPIAAKHGGYDRGLTQWKNKKQADA
jgi:hypothetical protein